MITLTEQIFDIVNVDKREFIAGDQLRWMYEDDDYAKTLESLFDAKSGKWRGNHVYVVGNFADKMLHDNRSEFDIPRKANQQALKLIHATPDSFEDSKLMAYSRDNFKEIYTQESHYKGRRYIYNTANKTYIDTSKLLINFSDLCTNSQDDFEFVAHSFSPLILLLALGNGYEWSDYSTPDSLVGSWALDSQFIVTSNKPIAKFADYKQFDVTKFNKQGCISEDNTVEQCDGFYNTSEGRSQQYHKLIQDLYRKYKPDIEFLDNYYPKRQKALQDCENADHAVSQYLKQFGFNKNQPEKRLICSDLVGEIERMEKVLDPKEKYDGIATFMKHLTTAFDVNLYSNNKLDINFDFRELRPEVAEKRLQHLKKQLKAFPSEEAIYKHLRALKEDRDIKNIKEIAMHDRYYNITNGYLDNEDYSYEELKALTKLMSKDKNILVKEK